MGNTKLSCCFPKAQPVIRGDIAPILSELGEGIREHYAELLRKKTNSNRKAIIAEIDAAKREKREREKRQARGPSVEDNQKRQKEDHRDL